LAAVHAQALQDMWTGQSSKLQCTVTKRVLVQGEWCIRGPGAAASVQALQEEVSVPPDPAKLRVSCTALTQRQWCCRKGRGVYTRARSSCECSSSSGGSMCTTQPSRPSSPWMPCQPTCPGRSLQPWRLCVPSTWQVCFWCWTASAHSKRRG